MKHEKKPRSCTQLVLCSCVFIGHYFFGHRPEEPQHEVVERRLASSQDDDAYLKNCPDSPGMFDMVDSAISFKVTCRVAELSIVDC